MASEPEIDQIRAKMAQDILTQQHQPKYPENVIEINSVDHFNQLVNDYKESVIIVDFWAPWCGPCRAFGPTFQALQKEYSTRQEKVLFTKLNTEELGIIAQQFGISGIPTTIFIHNKKIVHHNVGALPKAQFDSVVKAVLKKLQ